VWDYSRTIAMKWAEDEFQNMMKKLSDQEIAKTNHGDLALRYVDSIVANDIRNGMRGVEFIAINPMFRSAWKKFYRSLIYRDASKETICEEEGKETSETIQADEVSGEADS